jgi:predicted nucleic acid-binding protein
VEFLRFPAIRARGVRFRVFGRVRKQLTLYGGRSECAKKEADNASDMFVFDTNTLIYYAAGEERVVSFLNEHQRSIFYIPSIVAAEFLSYPLITESSVNVFREFVYQTTMINLDFSLAEYAAALRRIYGVKLMDAIVAATALAANATLITRNIRDFKKIPELRTYNPFEDSVK